MERLCHKKFICEIWEQKTDILKFSFSKPVKGHNFVKKPYSVIGLCQIVAVVMVNKCDKFHKICYVIFNKARFIKFLDNNNDNADAGVALFFFFET